MVPLVDFAFLLFGEYLPHISRSYHMALLLCYKVLHRLINHVNVVGCQTNLDVIAGVPYPNSFLHHLHDLPVRFYVHLSLGSDVRFCFELPKQKLLSKG